MAAHQQAAAAWETYFHCRSTTTVGSACRSILIPHKSCREITVVSILSVSSTVLDC